MFLKVHGNWSSWSSWGACTVTCGVGLERRDRSCTHPVPGPNGHPCVGDSHEDRVCMVKACAGNILYLYLIITICLCK